MVKSLTTRFTPCYEVHFLCLYAADHRPVSLFGELLSTIPATDIEPVFARCPDAIIASEVHKTSGYHYGSTAGKERVVVGGKTVDVYFIDSVAYSYDKRGRLVREQGVSTGGHTDETFTYSPGLLVSKWISYDKLGVERQVYPWSVALNDRGYEVIRGTHMIMMVGE